MLSFFFAVLVSEVVSVQRPSTNMGQISETVDGSPLQLAKKGRISESVKDETEWIDWKLCDSAVHSNLGGLGPDTGVDNIRFSHVFTDPDGQKVDMIVTNLTEYRPLNSRVNGKHDCIGQINLKTESHSAVLRFQFVYNNTLIEVPVQNYIFSIFDIDQSGTAVENVRFLTPILDYWVPDDSILNVTGTPNNNLTARATTFGNLADNPTDPAAMTNEQITMGITVEYESVSSFDILFDLDISIHTETTGRNIFFSGWSAIAPTHSPTPSPTPSPTVLSYIDWNMCNTTKLHNNLGGLGPDEDEEALRFYDVYVGSDGKSVDLLVTNVTEYTAKDTDKNLVSGCLGQVNVKVGTSVSLLFQFVKTGTSDLVDEANYLFSLYDIDAGGKATERIIFITDVERHWVREDVNFHVVGDVESNLTFTATTQGDYADNPVDPSNMTEEQLDVSGTVLYSGLSSFVINFDVMGSSKAGRNFVFSGWSQLVE